MHTHAHIHWPYNSLSPEVEIEKQCLLVMGFPPSLHPCVESMNFAGKDTEQLVKLIVQVTDNWQEHTVGGDKCKNKHNIHGWHLRVVGRRQL